MPWPPELKVPARATVSYQLVYEELGGSGAVWGGAMTAIFSAAP